MSSFVVAILLFSFVTAFAAEPDGERARIAAVTRPTSDFSRSERYESRPGGATTVFKTLNRDIFSHPSANMPFDRQLDFRVGNGIFKKVWVSSPSSTTSSDGLGPLFNARACQRCHLKDGRGHTPAPGERAESMFLRLSVPYPGDGAAPRENRRAGIPEPTYGEQLQNFSVQGVPAEGEMTIAYREQPVALAGGKVASGERPGEFLASSGHGGATIIEAWSGRSNSLDTAFVNTRRWDNHLATG